MKEFFVSLAVAIISGLLFAHYKDLTERAFQLTLRNDGPSRKLVFQVALVLVVLGFLLGSGLTGAFKILDFKKELASVLKQQEKLALKNERLETEIQIYFQTFIEEKPNKALAGNIRYTPRSRYCQEKKYPPKDCFQKWSLERSALVWQDALAEGIQ
jgi:hypothetical protein